MAGGRIASPARVQALAAAARKHGLAVHVDGARLVNAAVALGCKPAELVAAVDSTSLCLSKGLGAPVGSLLAGDAAFVKQAVRTRKAFGGGMRQAGILAAAGLLALRDGPELMVRDHARARQLAKGLAEVRWGRVDVAAVETNIVMFDVPDADPDAALAHLRAHGVLAAKAGPARVRFVLHRDVPDDGVERCLAACRSFVPTTRSTPSSR
jgi:threonine aldolase